MLSRKFIPAKFIFAIGQIVLAGILMATSNVYPAETAWNGEFIAGCALIILMVGAQIGFTFVGINISNARINFQNMIFNGFGLVLLIWYALDEWDQKYIWYVWGFLCLYPFFNDFFGMVSVLFHSNKKIFEKYRAEQ